MTLPNVHRMVLAGTLLASSSVFAADKIHVSFPSEHAHVIAGKATPIGVRPSEGVELKSAYASVGAARSSDVTESPFTPVLMIPADARGEIAVDAFAVDARGKKLHAVVHLMVDDAQTAALPQALEVLPSQIFFTAPGDRRDSIFTRASFRDGSVKEVSHLKETVFQSSDPSIATVDEMGRVQARKPGVCGITVRYGALTRSIRVSVGANENSPERRELAQGIVH